MVRPKGYVVEGAVCSVPASAAKTKAARDCPKCGAKAFHSCLKWVRGLPGENGDYQVRIKGFHKER